MYRVQTSGAKTEGETNPESGTTTYKYDSDSNCASPNSSTGDLLSRTDARNIRTCYQYDTLHRLTQKNYSDGTTPMALFIYDETSNSGVTESNTKGRLTTEGSYQNGWLAATKFSYDAMGRVILNPQETQTSWFGWQPSYTYDLAGNRTSYTNGAGVTLTQSFDGAGRITSLTSSLVDSQHPATLFTADSSLGYYPASVLRKGAFGNGLTQSNVYNSLLQPCLIDVNNNSTTLQTCNDSTPSGNVVDFWMSYNAGSNNGDVVNWNATGVQSFVRTFGYDSLNRLAQMQETTGAAEGCKPSSSSSNPYSITWGYDPWGNRTSQSPNAGTCSFSQNVNTQNQLSSPYQYDAGGNLVADGSHTYTYDAENRLISVDGGSTATYVYDAIGRRMQRTVGGSTINYIYDMAGNVEAEFGCATCWNTGYIYLNGWLAALYANSTTYFAHADHLGSNRLLTDLNQNVVQNLDNLPFGEILSTDSGISTHKFTGDERDSETGLDHTWFRQYSSSLGRWMHSDPAGLAAVDPTDPQSWNRYAYVENDPIDFFDPLGLKRPNCIINGADSYCPWLPPGGGGGAGGGVPIYGSCGGGNEENPQYPCVIGYGPLGSGGGGGTANQTPLLCLVPGKQPSLPGNQAYKFKTPGGPGGPYPPDAFPQPPTGPINPTEPAPIFEPAPPGGIVNTNLPNPFIKTPPNPTLLQRATSIAIAVGRAIQAILGGGLDVTLPPVVVDPSLIQFQRQGGYCPSPPRA